MIPSDYLSECRSCGACCANFRILLNWTEVNDFNLDGVPIEMTIKISDFIRVMTGTETSPHRCIALKGEIGKGTTCGIYEQRSSMCREFNPIWDDGTINHACDEARAAYFLPHLIRGEKSEKV